MKTNDFLYKKIEEMMPQYIDSYDNDSFCMMLDEIAEIKKEHV